MCDKTSLIRHNVCKKEFLVAPKMFLGVKQTRCPYCSNKNRGKYLRDENFLEKLISQREDGQEYQWLEKYNFNNKKKLKILHKTCNRSYEVRPNDFQQGYSCPYCNLERTESKYIIYLKDLLKENSIEFEKEKSFDGLKYKDKLTCDIFIPSLNIVIEYDGKQHFKPTFSKKDFPEQKKRDKVKNNYFLDSTYNFLRIPYYTIKSKKDIKEIIEELLKDKTISYETCKKFNLLYSNAEKDVIINKTSYYKQISHH